ncbi:MAG: helix-turn-helix domain-containing protein [Coriobacteriia bacterium]|nr:helix-turn-helix domain-containing protein [Coriobacteriia bacterium]MCL2870979.1 helix-turn-helix domain-containing protein [Coriobacteriia bacterium]
METKLALAQFRKNLDLTQDELAEKLFVTRQAISRWETGETTPSIDTLRLMSNTFSVSIDELLGATEDKFFCQSCAMHLRAIGDFGTETDAGISTDYCVYCYKDGSFTGDPSMDEMIETNLGYLDHWNMEQGTNYTKDEARAILKEHLPTLKRWKAEVPA